jgi:hypothetical protein
MHPEAENWGYCLAGEGEGVGCSVLPCAFLVDNANLGKASNLGARIAKMPIAIPRLRKNLALVRSLTGPRDKPSA